MQQTVSAELNVSQVRGGGQHRDYERYQLDVVQAQPQAHFQAQTFQAQISYHRSTTFFARVACLMSGLPDTDVPWEDPSLANAVAWVDPASSSASSSTGYTESQPLPANSIEADVGIRDDWDGDEWVGDAPESDSCTADYAGNQLAAFLIDKNNNGKWFATDICKVAYWATAGGMTGNITLLAKRPGLPTSHYNRQVKQVLGLDGKDESIDTIRIPSCDPADGSRVHFDLPVIHPTRCLTRKLRRVTVSCRHATTSSYNRTSSHPFTRNTLYLLHLV